MSIKLFKNSGKNAKIKDLSKRKSIIKIAAFSTIIAGGLLCVPILSNKLFKNSKKTYVGSRLSDFNDKYQEPDTKYSIDEYINNFVKKYSKVIEISSETEKNITLNKEFIIKYANQNRIPADLLATVVANESETRSFEQKTYDKLWDAYKEILNLAGYHQTRDSTEGIAQLRISTAGYYLQNIVKKNGINYILKKINKQIKNNEDYGQLERLLNKFDTVGNTIYHDNKNNPIKETAKGVFDDFSDHNRKYFIKNISKILSSDEISIELASQHLKYLSNGIKKVFNITDKDFISNPVALMINFRAYTQDENEISHKNKFPRRNVWFDRSSMALSLLKSNSKIKKIFSKERYQISSNIRQIQEIGDIIGTKSPEYKQIESLFKRAYLTQSAVERSEHLIHAYNLSMKVIFNENSDKRIVEFSKLAAYSIQRAKFALNGCGVENIKYHNYELLNESINFFGCTKKIEPNSLGIIRKNDVVKCIEVGYKNLLDKYKIQNQTIDIPYFGELIKIK
jgi:hypothetical protein